MSSKKGPCPVCGSTTVTLKYTKEDIYEMDCNHCGEYSLGCNAKSNIEQLSLNNKHKIAAVLLERRLQGLSGTFIVSDSESRYYKHASDTIADILKLFPSSGLEILDRTMLNLNHSVTHPIEMISLKKDSYNLFFCDNKQQMMEILGDLRDLGYTTFPNNDEIPVKIRIKPNGWNRISQLETSDERQNQAFVAMWFNESTNDIYENGIKPAIEECGITCIRIDQTEHNNKICDEIIIQIRRSKFVVADFTGNRAGVYFEAGYAMGKGIPIVWTVNETINKIHFDTRQYNHVVYNSPVELKVKLKARIKATVL